MNEAPKRRWFRPRYSLRTFFVAITLLCIWLGWNAQIVQDRNAIIAEIKKTSPEGGYHLVWLEELEANPKFLAKVNMAEADLFRVSWIRRLLGDRSYLALGMPGPVDPQLVERMENAFPEAQLVIYLPGDDARRDSLYAPAAGRYPNSGSIFKTGLR